MAINASKLLPAAKKSSSAIVKADKFLAPKKVDNESSSIIKSSDSKKKVFYGIKEKVIDVNKLLGGLVLYNKNQNAIQRKELEDDKREKKEEKLEKPKEDKKKGNLRLPSLPGKGLFASIGDFILKTLTGFILYRLVDYGPQILRFLKIAAPAFDFVIDIGGKLLNGLVTFVDWGYKAVDATKGFIKNIAGEDGAKNFDKLAGGLTTFMNYAVIAGMLAADSALSDEGFGRGGVRRRGFDRSGRRVGKDIQKRYFKRYGKEQFLRRFGKENLKNVGKDAARGALTKLGRNALVGTLGKGGTKALLRLAKPLLRNIPIIGGLAEFALSWALGDPIGKAAFRGIGSLLVGAVGTAIGGPIGAAIGGFVGGEVGGKLYEMFFENKKPTKKDNAPRKAGGGSVTRGGRLTSGPAKRTVRKTKSKRTVKITPQKIKPGNDVGGKKNLENLYSEREIELIEEQNKILGKAPFFGPLFSLVAKTLLGDRPDKLDYKNIGDVLNNWLSNTFSTNVGYAGGGEVNLQGVLSGDDMSDVIAKSFEESVSSEIDNALNELQKQLLLKGGDPRATQTAPGSQASTEGDFLPGSVPGGQLTMQQLVGLAKGAGFNDNEAVIMAAIAKAESGGNSNARNFKPPDKSYGLWQVNMIGRLGPSRMKEFGLQREDQLFDPVTNAKAAYSIRKSQGLSAWTVYKTGRYKNFLAQAEAARGAPSLRTSPSFGVGGIELGRGYGSAGGKIAGELGRFMKSKGVVPGSIHRHPEHPPYSLTSGHSRGSLHYQGRAIDLGANANEQGPILAALAEFNRLKGVKPVQVFHAGNDSYHQDHVHVAYARGGKTKGVPHFAMLGEEGKEFVIDADSTAALEATFPGFLDALNKAKHKEAINVLKSYMQYEAPEPIVIEVPVEVPVPMDNYGEGGGILPIPIGVNNNNDLWDSLNYG